MFSIPTKSQAIDCYDKSFTSYGFYHISEELYPSFSHAPSSSSAITEFPLKCFETIEKSKKKVEFSSKEKDSNQLDVEKINGISEDFKNDKFSEENGILKEDKEKKTIDEQKILMAVENKFEKNSFIPCYFVSEYEQVEEWKRFLEEKKKRLKQEKEEKKEDELQLDCSTLDMRNKMNEEKNMYLNEHKGDEMNIQRSLSSISISSRNSEASSSSSLDELLDENFYRWRAVCHKQQSLMNMEMDTIVDGEKQSDVVSWEQREMEERWKKEDARLMKERQTANGSLIGKDAGYTINDEKWTKKMKHLTKKHIQEAKMFYKIFGVWVKNAGIEGVEDEAMWEEEEEKIKRKENVAEDNISPQKTKLKATTDNVNANLTIEEMKIFLAENEEKLTEEEKSVMEKRIQKREKQMEDEIKKKELSMLERYWDVCARKEEKEKKRKENPEKREIKPSTIKEEESKQHYSQSLSLYDVNKQSGFIFPSSSNSISTIDSQTLTKRKYSHLFNKHTGRSVKSSYCDEDLSFGLNQNQHEKSSPKNEIDEKSLLTSFQFVSCSFRSEEENYIESGGSTQNRFEGSNEAVAAEIVCVVSFYCDIFHRDKHLSAADSRADQRHRDEMRAMCEAEMGLFTTNRYENANPDARKLFACDMFCLEAPKKKKRFKPTKDERQAMKREKMRLIRESTEVAEYFENHPEFYV
ncbi:uncharacterized protein MONOS_8315 [Monocercomonoides exilis]|uniref:uncharacterized protein n=1 Tax=Monocercomonoides exilis TaxID=2049356 RepID=UPI00355A208F|nr:hypothetical protein MONOS_8315 [Monocercomonoides exilis]|eukprot:MONOS_8315.1-p1 / transcript=MONOS_8315.1 / gene=MONOS_8315 / organism=Monocercomonoides_exilis_PA203 / gene_product=unspecified product / transcript_product=unspecified product / location=Mono_scaffold00311:23816-25897(+) / protein_length=694 / sequence_SO=supercontig / SO=protein_coding / is_pseudo=false